MITFKEYTELSDSDRRKYPYFPCHCPECNWIGMSNETPACYSDEEPICPKCLAKDDGAGWNHVIVDDIDRNYQQIIAFVSARLSG